jgi:DNA-3-methyladenine glycosylase II
MPVIRTQSDIKRGIAALAKADARLEPVIAVVEKVPLRLSTADFAGLAAIIVSQQVSKASADAIFGRLKALVDPLDACGMLCASDETLKAAGLSRPKQRTLRAIAEAVDSGGLDLAGLCELAPVDAVARMTAINGIGPWTAEVYLLFCAGHADIFPAGDLALQEAVRHAFSLDERPGDKQLREIARQWSPWRGVASRLLWAYYAATRGGREAAPV